jgi:hypothetical protein
VSFWEEHWPEILGGACVALLIALVVAAAIFESNRPCLRYETHHSNLTVIGYDYKLRPIYGPGEVQECVERAQ